MNLIDVMLAYALAKKAAASNTPASASVNEEGLISFKNSDGTTLFTLQLPLYAGAVEDGGAEIV